MSAMGLGRVKTRMRRDGLEQDSAVTALVFPRANYLLPALPADCKQMPAKRDFRTSARISATAFPI